MRTSFCLTLILGNCISAFACQCLPVSFEQEVQSSTSIFHGRVTQATHHTFDVEIIKMWKGNRELKTYRIEQVTSCSRRTFELNKEYIFYVQGNEVNNCSRTEEMELNIDDELLDVVFNNVGDRKMVIESDELTARQKVVLKNILVRHNIDHPSEVVHGKVVFAIGEELADKRAFFENARWHGPHMRVEQIRNTGTYLLWIGFDWKRASRKLKRQV
ncbi:MAG TPA: hypothetical protein VEB86_07340 [Chryseosolibacter sp.]|nr:hypothetical protein [Chryseosolibacter sp.]